MSTYSCYLQGLTNLNPLKTVNPCNNSNDKSIILADTTIKSKIFQPQRKKSLDNANTFITHSNVKTEVNT